jgi:phosphoglycerate kinase
VLVRVDLNVPMNGASVADDTRLRALLPTVLELSDKGAIVLLLSHFGRPKGQSRPDMSTRSWCGHLPSLAAARFGFVEDCQGPEAERAISIMLPGGSASWKIPASTRAKRRTIPALPRAWRRSAIIMSTTLSRLAPRPCLDRGRRALAACLCRPGDGGRA